LIFPFPEENLPFTLHDLIHQLGLFLSYFIDIYLKFNGLSFHLFKFLDELALKIDILILEFTLFIAIDSDIIVKLIHFLL